MEKNKYIKIKNAKENNLKNISIEIPKEKLIVITGVSGSGKSSLAFDVLYSEGRRRYVDSLSNYARQFLGGTSKPDVESIEGLSPAIAIDQKTTSNNPRSTVGTTTEIYDFYRLLYSRIGRPFCPVHNIEITSQSITQIVNKVMERPKESWIQIMSPVIIDEKGTHHELLEKLKKESFIRVKIDGKVIKLDSEIILSRTKKHNISIIIDRVEINDTNRSRIFEGIQIASEHSDGIVIVADPNTDYNELFSRNFACPHGDFSLPKIEPRMFSFNSPQGACDTCKGLGFIEKPLWDKMVFEEKSIIDGGLKFFGEKMSGMDWQELMILLKHYQIPLDKALKNFTDDQKNILINGSDEPIKYTLQGKTIVNTKINYIEGIGTKINRRYLSTDSDFARTYYKKFLGESVCTSCLGKRLNVPALSVKINELNIYELSIFSIENAYIWFQQIKLTGQEKEISKLVIDEIMARFEFLINVGLGYLTLNRIARTLSGGESQRIRLASQLGSKLTGVIYVLDEPSIGLHQRDNAKLIRSLKGIRDLGNTVVVVEHDEETMMESDYIIDIGPLAGDQGGEIVAHGVPKELLYSNGLTGKFLSGRDKIEVPKKRRGGNGKVLQIAGARANNLKNLTISIPLNTFVAVTGVSGSGKSTLINEILYKKLHNQITKGDKFEKVGEHDAINGHEHIDKIVNVSQSPIGRTPRSNPATYTGVFDNIRDVFALTRDAQIRGYKKGRFSFNVKDGRCDKCNGDGTIKISMHFLPDVYVTCSLCDGKRYNEETLQIKYRGKNIADILAMSVNEAHQFFINLPKIKNNLQYLIDVGLGYISLGHPSTLISGGEAQRIKLATYLQKRPTGKTLYILDEPTTGLHNYDIKKLLLVLNRIVDNGDSVIVIEHNLDVIKTADYIIDLGPEGGEHGGEIIAAGRPEAIVGVKGSATAPFLKKVLKRDIQQ
ncbi:MAG: excinuclease ABC subunit UvrA [Mycoplasmataceae bacterium]|nr:excinuclease ABC subunit UvrA [Mycoplasmataceae bacterium]